MIGTATKREKRAYSLEDLEKETPMSIGFYRKEIREKRLRAKLVGSRVVVMAEDLEQYLAAAPDWTPGTAPVAAMAALEARRKEKV